MAGGLRLILGLQFALQINGVHPAAAVAACSQQGTMPAAGSALSYKLGSLHLNLDSESWSFQFSF